MKFSKKKLCDLPYCYAVSAIRQDGRLKYLFAPDAYGPCYAFDSETFRQETIWEGPGGTMSIVPLPDKNGEFLAVREFNPDFQAQNAEIVHVSFSQGKWHVSKILKLPYVHRFDILDRSGIRYIICCTVCTEKKSINDWSSPGAIYAAELPDDLSKPIQLITVAEGMTRNHGYWRVQNNGFTSAMTACDQGVFEVIPPAEKDDSWTIRSVLKRPVSDIALWDIDGDGQLEMAAIEEFHGDNFVVYKKHDNKYIPIYQHPGKLDFCHVVWGGLLRGDPVFIGGARAEEKELFLLHWKKGKINLKVIEKSFGPSNVYVIQGKEKDIILVANREAGEGAIFEVTDS